MKLETDTATLAAVGMFLVIQGLVYVFCLIRLASVKRLNAPAQLKLKLLENEENLFDLGLYIGLGGTVVSLVLLTVGVVTASLMAAYTSTLFGILFTALVKIVHVRRYKRKQFRPNPYPTLGASTPPCTRTTPCAKTRSRQSAREPS